MHARSDASREQSLRTLLKILIASHLCFLAFFFGSRLCLVVAAFFLIFLFWPSGSRVFPSINDARVLQALPLARVLIFHLSVSAIIANS